MYRSSSWNRISDDLDGDSVIQVPIYDENIDIGKKERPRAKLANNAVHLIPFVLILCALVLWLFSNTPGIDLHKW